MANYVDTSAAWDEGTLQDWYLSSIDNTIPPIWTEEHISELCNDFIVIPKEAPAADVRPERYARYDWEDENSDYASCSCCSFQVERPLFNDFNYCPYCGAKLDVYKYEEGSDNG